MATGAGALTLVIVAFGVSFLMLNPSPPVGEDERDAVESFTRAVLDVEAERDAVATEFERIGAGIRTTEFAEVFRTLESVIPRQEQLTQEIRFLNSPGNTTALAHTLFADAYEQELSGYRLLNRVASQAQATFPNSTARRLRRMDGYVAALGHLSQAEHSRARAYEELAEVLARVGLSLEEVGAGN